MKSGTLNHLQIKNSKLGLTPSNEGTFGEHPVFGVSPSFQNTGLKTTG